jgi:sec-independent protein translocase protein TatA
MPNIGPMELIVVLIVALVILGPKRLPAAGRSLGRGITEFRGGLSGGRHEPTELVGLPETAEPTTTTTIQPEP